MPSWKKIIVSGSNVSQLNNDSGYAKTGSANTFYGNQTVNGDVVVTGSITALQYIISSSVIYVTESNFSGSTVFGNTMDDTHQFTGSVYITGSINNVDYIDFNTGSVVPAWKSGRVYWDNTDGCLAVYNAEADITLQVGQENWTRIYNDTGANINNGEVVRITGTHGDTPKVVKALSIAVSGAINQVSQLIGVATHTIEPSTFGYITTQGLVRGLNTNAYTDGDTLFLSNTTPGAFTNVAPGAPFEIVPIGEVIKASPGGSGIIYVAVQQPLDFGDLSSVYVSGSYHYGDLLVYVPSSSYGVWTHTNQLSASYGLTGSLNVISGGITGSLYGTASWAYSSSQALTASYYNGAILNSQLPSQISVTGVTASFTGSLIGSLTGTASYATIAATASFLPIGTYNITASWAQSASQALTASYGNLTGSLFGTASWAVSASRASTASFLPAGTYNITASWANRATTSSYVSTLGAAGASGELQYNNGGILGGTTNIKLDSGYINFYTSGAIGTVLFANPTEFGIYDLYNQNPIATYDRSNTTYWYAGGNYYYNGSSHTMGGRLYVSNGEGLYIGSVGGKTGLGTIDEYTIASYDKTHSLWYYSNDYYQFNGAGPSHIMTGSFIACVDPSTSNYQGINTDDTTLRDTNGIRVNWASSVLKAIDYTTPQTTLKSVDWDARLLYGTDGGTPQTELNSVDWGNRYLYAGDGTTIVVNWQTNVLNDNGGAGSADWENRKLYNTSGQDSVKWNDYVLYEPVSGVESVNWSTLKTKDVDGETSIDWGNRILYAGNGGNEVNQALVWSDSSTSNGVRLYGTASVALNVPKAGGVLAASFGGSPLTASVSFNTTMANYSVAIVGADARIWTVQNIGSSGFTINSNSSTLLTGNVYWTATPHSNP